MKKKSFLSALIFAMTSCGAATPSFADDSKPITEHHRYAVVDLNCGVPSGCVGELGFRPWYFLKLEAGAGYNGLAPGVIGSVVFDPIPWGLGLSLSLDAGHYWSGAVPFVSNPPSAEYSFLSPMVGIEMGNYKAWRFYLRGGLTYLAGNASNLPQPDGGDSHNSLVLGNPTVNGWAAPAFKFGFSFYF